MNVKLDYPTANRYFTVKIKNTGTIKARLSLEDLSKANRSKICYYNSSDNSLDGDCGDLSLVISDSSYGATESFYNRYIVTVEVMGFETSNGSIITNEEELFETKYFNSNGITLEPNESVYFTYNPKWSEYAGETDAYRLGEKYFKFILNYQYPFKQVND